MSNPCYLFRINTSRDKLFNAKQTECISKEGVLMTVSKTTLSKCSVITLIICFAISTLLLCGCGGKNYEEIYVGKWYGSGEVTATDGLTYNQTVSLTINSDKSWTMTQNVKGRVIGLVNETNNFSGNWSYKDNTIQFNIVSSSTANVSSGEYFQGEYFDNQKTLNLTSNLGTLTKQSNQKGYI